jgi:hypothetical protein
MIDDKPMSSHELARILLSKRDMTVKIQVEYDDDAKEDGSGIVETHRTNVLRSLGYDSTEDALIIEADFIAGPSWGED